MVAIIKVYNPTWKEVKMELTKGLKGVTTAELEKHALSNVANLKQCDMFGQFPTYMARHVFVKVVAK